MTTSSNSYDSVQGRLYLPAPKFERLRAEGYRLCHNRSARKHRRQGHRVFYAGVGLYAWKVK